MRWTRPLTSLKYSILLNILSLLRSGLTLKLSLHPMSTCIANGIHFHFLDRGNDRDGSYTCFGPTLPKTNSSPLKMDAWNTSYVSFWGPAYFQGCLLLVSGSCTSCLCCPFINIRSNIDIKYQRTTKYQCNIISRFIQFAVIPVWIEINTNFSLFMNISQFLALQHNLFLTVSHLL